VIPGSFSYHRPSSVAEAVGLLAKLGDDGRALAGGHSLIPMMKLRLAEPAHLVDLAGIKLFLEDALGVDVDVTTRDSLHPMLRKNIEQSAVRVF